MALDAQKPNREPVMVRVLLPARGSKPAVQFVQGKRLGEKPVAQSVDQAGCRYRAISISTGLIQPDYRKDECIGAGVKLTQAIDAARAGIPPERLGLDPLTVRQREILRSAERAVPGGDSIDRRECRQQFGFEDDQLTDEAAQLRLGKSSQFPLEEPPPSVDAGEDHCRCGIVRDIRPREHDDVTAKTGEDRLSGSRKALLGGKAFGPPQLSIDCDGQVVMTAAPRSSRSVGGGTANCWCARLASVGEGNSRPRDG